MKPSVQVAWGGGLHILGHPAGPRSVAMDTTNAIGQNNITNAWDRTSVGFFNNYYNGLYGGPLSLCPNGFANHKPGTFYFGDFYFQKSLVSQQSMQLYMLRFDGSGQYINASNFAANEFRFKSQSGRGVDFLSPSGSHGVTAHPLCTLVHNGVLFSVGAFMLHGLNTLTTAWTILEDWNVKGLGFDASNNDAGNFLPRRRIYGAVTIHKKTRFGKEFRDIASNATRFHNPTSLSGIAPDSECMGACDAISWENSIIYANHADVVEFPGGSGVPQFIERNNVEVSAKCFEPYSSSGFDSNGNSVGQDELMMLTSSGVLKRVLFPGDALHNPSGQPSLGPGFGVASGRPFGMESLVSIGDLVSDFFGPKVRNDGQRGRLIDEITEPTRSCLLRNFNNKLNAFFISATSGYYHFQCNGNPRVLTNWEDRTSFLPDEFKIFDGDMYGYVDENFSRLSCMHVAKSNIGLYGVAGGNRGAGGWSIYELTQENDWINRQVGGALSPGIGFIPYDPQGVFPEMPSGTFASNPEVLPSTDYALLKYQLFTPRAPGLKVDVNIEYSINNGITWNEATQFKDYNTGLGLGEGKTNLNASPGGDIHDFFWAHVKDVGLNLDKDAKLRVRPKNVGAQ